MDSKEIAFNILQDNILLKHVMKASVWTAGNPAEVQISHHINV
jgi:hypothetical protein